MSGKDFANLALTFVEAFESGKVPPPETIFQVWTVNSWFKVWLHLF